MMGDLPRRSNLYIYYKSIVHIFNNPQEYLNVKINRECRSLSAARVKDLFLAELYELKIKALRRDIA